MKIVHITNMETINGTLCMHNYSSTLTQQHNDKTKYINTKVNLIVKLYVDKRVANNGNINNINVVQIRSSKLDRCFSCQVYVCCPFYILFIVFHYVSTYPVDS